VKTKLRLLAVILLLAAGLLSQPLRWSPAHFRGLVVGSSHVNDVKRRLGPPDWTFYTPAITTMHYKGRGDHKGDLTVSVDNRSEVIREIQESFPVAIPRTEIYKELGRDALTAHYSRAKCAGGALYRDPAGALELTLYPERGIVLWPDQFGYDFAAIHYLARQPGTARTPACSTRH
jgi:hypothetical protein